MTNIPIPPVRYVTTLPLKHAGDCNLIGVTPDYVVYAEEVYGDALVAQHAVRLDGSLIATVDEAESALPQPLELPPDLFKPKTGWHTMALNFAGPRHRGLRAPERTDALVRSLSVQEKMLLIERFKIDVIPPLLIGLAESYVLAESRIGRSHLYFVCRRVRLAWALPEARLDGDDQPYDYDTLVLYLAHFYERDDEPKLEDVLVSLSDMPLHRPMDCLLVGDHLFIADGGSADGGANDRLSAVHVWQLDLSNHDTSELDALNKKIYG